MSDKKPCVVCGTKLSSVNEDWKHMQPYGGGEIQLIFSFGSTKYDLNIGATTFRGVICDGCAEKMMINLEIMS